MGRGLLLMMGLLGLAGCSGADSVGYSASEVSGVNEAIRNYYFPEGLPDDPQPYFVEHGTYTAYQDGVNEAIRDLYFPPATAGGVNLDAPAARPPQVRNSGLETRNP